MVYQSTQQINGTAAHKSVDQATYTTRKDILSIANKEAIEKIRWLFEKHCKNTR